MKSDDMVEGLDYVEEKVGMGIYRRVFLKKTKDQYGTVRCSHLRDPFTQEEAYALSIGMLKIEYFK